MGAPSLSYTLTNGQTADASQVMQNLNDLLNGATDGTKDLTFFGLTVNGNAVLNGNVTLGNGSVDDVAFTGSLASSIPVKTANTFDLGTDTFPLHKVYLGQSGKSVNLGGSASGSAVSTTFLLPPDAGTSRYKLQTDGSGTTTWVQDWYSPSDFKNVALTATVSANALTVALKGADGTDPSSTNPVDIIFRSSTAATGTPVRRSATAATSVVVSSGSTLGHTNAVDEYVYVYAIDNAGTVELAVCGGAQIFDTNTRQTTTAEGGGGAADSRYTLYATAVRTNVGIRLLGRLKSNQAAAGTWVTAISEISLAHNGIPKVQNHLVTVTAGNGFGSSSTKIRRYTNTLNNIGTAITYADSATLGATFTINEEGVYAGVIHDLWGGGSSVPGISLNSSQLTTDIQSITSVDIISSLSTAPSGQSGTNSFFRRLKPGDILRPHMTGVEDSTSSAFSRFSITKISD